MTAAPPTPAAVPGEADSAAGADALATETALIEVRIPGRTEFIGVARSAVDAVSEQMQLGRDARAAVKLAVGEACNNAVIHARSPQHGGAGFVRVACRIDGDGLEIDVTNQGNGFYPPAPAQMPEGTALAESGRGMALMEMLMDSVEYLSENGDTIVRMRKKRGAK